MLYHNRGNIVSPQKASVDQAEITSVLLAGCATFFLYRSLATLGQDRLRLNKINNKYFAFVFDLHYLCSAYKLVYFNGYNLQLI